MYKSSSLYHYQASKVSCIIQLYCREDLDFSDKFIFCLGPFSDHTSGRGTYLYIETSPPRQAGDAATLRYDFPLMVKEGCFSMYYHMYGSGIGSLNVSTQDQNLWSLVGEQGNRWQQAFVSIPPQTTMVRRHFCLRLCKSVL